MPHINIPWNKYEIALLAEACINVANGVITRKDAVSQLSKRLRYAITKLGVILSDTYRNENGIGLQMQSMDYCLTNGKKGLPSHSKLFEEIAQLVTDVEGFAALLSDANRRYPLISTYDIVETNRGGKVKVADTAEVSEPQASIYSPVGDISTLSLLKVNIYDYVDNARQKGVSSYRISDILDAFSAELKKFGVKSVGELRLWLAKQYPDWWVANYYVIISKSTFNRDKAVGFDNTTGIVQVGACPSEKANTENSNVTEAISPQPNVQKEQEPRQKGNIKPFPEQLKKKVYDRASVLLSEGKHALGLSGIYRYFKDDFNEIGIYTYEDLKRSLKSEFPAWVFVNHFIKSLGNDAKAQVNSRAVNNKRECGLRPQIDTVKDTHASKLKPVLLKNFARGYRLDSMIERRKLIRFYEELHGESCVIPVDDIDQAVRSLGIVSGVKVYFPELMLSVDTRDKIHEYIQSRFASGVKYLYYIAIQKAFDNELLDSQIVNVELLKDFLRLLFPKYCYYRDYLAISSGIRPDIDAEVIRFVKEAYAPVSEQDIAYALYFLPADGIHASFTQNGNILIPNNRNNERFHIDNFVISSKDIKTITTDISQTISKEEYISWNDFAVYLRKNLPHLFSDNPQITEFGIRNVLKVLLKRTFNINNNVISTVGDEITVERILRRFICNHDTFTLLEAKELTSSFGTGIYWDQLTREAVRIDESRFVAKHSVRFDVHAIDKVLEEFCPGNYISLESVSLFSLLPVCGFPWNSFLLENYVDRYSVKFKVVHNQYLQKSVRGAIVRKDVKIDTLDDLILDFLVSSEEQYTAEEALEVLKEEKLIARARYEGIDHIVEKAILMRQNNNE